MDNGRMQLIHNMEALCAGSRDENYTKYLEMLLLQLRQGRITEAYAAFELNRTYQLYQQRMGMLQQNLRQPMQYVQPQYAQQSTQYMSVRQHVQQPAQSVVPQQYVQQSVRSVVQQYVQQPAQSVVPQQYVQQSAQSVVPQQYVQQSAQFVVPQQYIQQSAQPMPAQQYAQQPVQSVAPQQYVQQPAQLMPVQQYIQQPQQPPAKGKRKNIEFAVGAGVLSVVGILFVLTAFVLLSIYYMNDMLKGICLYVIAAAGILFSELYLERKKPKFAVGFTGLGICSLYLLTMVNHFYFHNFNVWVTAGILVFISVSAMLLGRKRDSGIFKMLSLAGYDICIFSISIMFLKEQGNMQIIYFAVIALAILLVNLLTAFLPVKKSHVMVNRFHLIVNVVFSVAFVNLGCRYLEKFSYLLFFVSAIVFVQGIIFYQLEKPYLGGEKHKGKAGNVAIYAVTVSVLLLCFVILSPMVVRDGLMLHLHFSSGILLAVCAVLFLLFRKSSLKWIQYWLFCPTILLAYNLKAADGWFGIFQHSGSMRWWGLGVTLATFAVAKLLSRQKILRVSELCITIFTAMQAVTAFENYSMLGDISAILPEKEADMAGNLLCGLCILGAFLLSLAALYEWKSLYEEIVMLVCVAFIGILFRNELMPAALMCVMFAGVISFNSLEFFRGKYIKIFNYINLALMVCVYLAAAFIKNPVSYGILLVLGISFMVLAFREKFGMDFKIKNIIFVLFLCYMVLIWNIPLPVLKSLLFMIIAIGAVAAGFAFRQKKLRVTGLILVLAACAKIVFFDFADVRMAEKIILFLIAGLIALAISGIYLALEKKIV